MKVGVRQYFFSKIVALSLTLEKPNSTNILSTRNIKSQSLGYSKRW